MKIITQDEFEESLHYGSHYTGYVKGVGHVKWNRYLTLSETPSYPFTGSIHTHQDVRYPGEELFVPEILPEEELLAHADIPHKDILDAILEYKVEDKMTMTLFDGRKVDLDSRNTKIDITTQDKNHNGKVSKVVTVTAEDRVNNFKVQTEALLTDVLDFLEENLDYVSYPASFWEYQIGRHYSNPDVHRFKPIMTQDGYYVAKPSSRYNWGPFKYQTTLKIGNMLKFVGYGFGGLSIVSTSIQYFVQQSIPQGKAYGDMFFGVVGFFGVPGAAISTFYFMTISRDLDRSIQNPPVNYNDISFPRDNTRVVLPYHPLIY